MKYKRHNTDLVAGDNILSLLNGKTKANLETNTHNTSDSISKLLPTDIQTK